LVILTTLSGHNFDFFSSWERDPDPYEGILHPVSFFLQVGMLGRFSWRSISFLFYMFLGSNARANVLPDRRVGAVTAGYTPRSNFFLYTLVGFSDHAV